MQQQANPLDSAHALRNLILENRHETESKRQLAQPIIDALVETRLGRLALPAQYAGLEMPPADALAVFEELARAEASVAWIVWNSTLPCWFSRFLGADARAEIFGDPTALYASSTRPSGRALENDGAYIVNGRWSLVSGCMHAAWIPVMCMVEVDGQVQMLAPDAPHIRMIFVPRSAHKILDTWHVGGLRGTGSHDCELSDVSTQPGHSFAVGEPGPRDSAFANMPITATMAAGCAAICIGIASSCSQALVELATGSRPADGSPGLGDRAPVQSIVATAQTRLQAMRDRLFVATASLWEDAAAGTPVPAASIGAVFSAAVTAARDCRRLVTQIHDAAGTAALYIDSPIERGHRDIDAVMKHVVVQPFWLEQAGRVHIGLQPTHPLFAI